MPMTRRQFAAGIGFVALTAWGAPVFANDDESTTVRVIACNVFGGTGWPANRPRAMQAVERGEWATRMADELALHKPDIISFSESPGERVAQQIAEQLGMNHVRFPSGGKWPGTLLTRFEIVDSKNVPLEGQRPRELFTRHWGRATLQLPTGQQLIVHSAHLFPGEDPAVRLREIAAMLETMKADLDAGRSMLLLGDLNHVPDSREYRLWIDAGWVDTFARVGKGKGFTISSDIPKWRIDYVMAAGPVARGIVESRPLFEGAFRLKIADKQSWALSDHLPQMAVFQLPQ